MNKEWTNAHTALIAEALGWTGSHEDLVACMSRMERLAEIRPVARVELSYSPSMEEPYLASVIEMNSREPVTFQACGNTAAEAMAWMLWKACGGVE